MYLNKQKRNIQINRILFRWGTLALWFAREAALLGSRRPHCCRYICLNQNDERKGPIVSLLLFEFQKPSFQSHITRYVFNSMNLSICCVSFVFLPLKLGTFPFKTEVVPAVNVPGIKFDLFYHQPSPYLVHVFSEKRKGIKNRTFVKYIQFCWSS